MTSSERHRFPGPAARRRRNIRLRDAMNAVGLTFTGLADAVGCHSKTAQRWFYEGRLPTPEHAEQIAARLRTSPDWLWPATSRTRAEVLGDHAKLFARLDGEPDLIIHGIVASARKGLKVCSGSGWFLERAAPRSLRRRNPIPMRVLVPPTITWNDPQRPEVHGIQLRKHTGVGQLSFLCGDDAMIIVNAMGMEAADAPALFLSRACDGGAFDLHADGFETMWAQAFEDEFVEESLWRGSDV